jgi:glucosamine--fructose-6-phosphate aminotransferase (isomerizing)
MEELADEYLDSPIFTFIGSGPNWVTALLAAAKMKETSQSRSEATNLEEYAHLHCLSLMENDLVIIITAPGPIGERNRLVCQHIQASGGKLIVVGPSQELDSWHKLNVAYCQVPDHNELFGPIIGWIPLQLFAYFVAVGKKRNPDRSIRFGPMDYLQKIIYTSMLEGWEKR